MKSRVAGSVFGDFRRLGVALAAVVTAAAVHAAAQPSPAIPVTPGTPAHPPTQGMPVVDNAGVVVGVIAAVADSERGAMVVVRVDGKLVSLPQASLVLDGKVARSSRTKAQILAAAAAR
jgi:hypothetical protein